jgi:murein L,D-transpeptidase YafK
MPNPILKLSCITIFCVTTFLCFTYKTAADFKTEQIKNIRVKNAYEEKEASLKELYKQKGINFGSQQIFLRAFKEEKIIELWARSSEGAKFILIKSYDICSSSGSLGPKRKKGDDQTPEGFYSIDRFNPTSLFHLSLGLDYPNESDKLLGEKANLGGDIFIHGSCVTIGCIPLTDDKIKEVYIAAVEAKSKGQKKIQVHIFPCRLTEKNFVNLKSKYISDRSLLIFWENLKQGYDHFENTHMLPAFSIAKDGKYKFL